MNIPIKIRGVRSEIEFPDNRIQMLQPVEQMTATQAAAWLQVDRHTFVSRAIAAGMKRNGFGRWSVQEIREKLINPQK